MSDDLVKRLRDWEFVYPEEESEPEGSLYFKAADRIEELETKLTRATAVLRKVDRWFDELEMYTAPDYHLAPALQEVKAILKEMDE